MTGEWERDDKEGKSWKNKEREEKRRVT